MTAGSRQVAHAVSTRVESLDTGPTRAAAATEDKEARIERLRARSLCESLGLVRTMLLAVVSILDGRSDPVRAILLDNLDNTVGDSP